MIKILVVDDQNIVRQGIQALLESTIDIEVLGTAQDGYQALEQIQNLRPDIVITDVEMPRMDGLTLTHRISQEFPQTKVLILSSHESEEYSIQVLKAGAKGYLLKSTLSENLEQAIRLVNQGYSQIEPRLMEKLMAKAFAYNSVNLQKVVLKIDDKNEIDQDKSFNLEREQAVVSEKHKAPSEATSVTSINKYNFKLLVFVPIVAFFVGISLFSRNLFSSTTQALPPEVAVEVKKIGNIKVRSSSEFVGQLEAKQKVSLASRVEGRILEIVAKEGDTVKKGDLIAKLQQSREQGEVNSAKSEVNIQRANVSNSEAELRSVEAEAASAEALVEESKANLRQQEAELALATTNIERSKFLVKEGAQSQQNLDNRTRDLDTAKAQTDALKAVVNSNEKALSAVKERVVSARSAISGQQAALKQAETRVNIASDNLDFNRIVAPIDGIVGNIQPKIGEYLEAGGQITSITKDEALELSVSVPLEQTEELKIGLPVEVIDSQGKAIAEGDVSFISPKVDRSSQAVLVKAAFNNDGRLKDDSFARARIIWSEKVGVLIPTEAVSRIAGKSFVFVAQEKKQKDSSPALVAVQKPVNLGAIQGQSYQVISGLELGDLLITTGISNLADGIPINLEKQTVTTQELDK